MSLFDKLQGELDDRNSEGGISPVDLLDLPESLRRIMRHMLRAVTMPRKDIVAVVASWPEKDRFSEEELDKALKSLVHQGWLIEIGEGDLLGYRVNLRRKKGSENSIWGTIGSRIDERIELNKRAIQNKPEGEEPPKEE
ncbi:MAG: hypothetical protein EPO32_14320 [Anaerolineae bacterium]|nr:MAG: hypothetical protein EPO32_14320 [Anaerolineae bacterium]